LLSYAPGKYARTHLLYNNDNIDLTSMAVKCYRYHYRYDGIDLAPMYLSA